MTGLSALVGEVLKAVTGGVNDDKMVMTFDSGLRATFLHYQDCCENVCIEDVNGDWEDLIGHPILVAECRSDDDYEPTWAESATWTFYTFRSVGGSVDVRWFGESNGYYSEEVDVEITMVNDGE